MNPDIQSGSTVRIEYTLTDETGEILDSTEGREPLTYVHGRRQIIPGLEQALAGLRVGDQKQVTVAPKDAYGLVDPQARAEVPRHAVPPEALVPGTELVARSADGATRLVTVLEIRPDTVVVDLNHPLAGKTLRFDVRVVEVSPPLEA